MTPENAECVPLSSSRNCKPEISEGTFNKAESPPNSPLSNLQKQKLTLRSGALTNLRHTQGILQQELADRMSVSQAHIASIEQKPDMLLSTLRRYIQSLGGELDLVARFPDVSYHLGRNG